MNINLEILSSIAGATSAVSILTQMLKSNIKLDPKWIALAISILIQIFVLVVIVQDYTIQGIGNHIFNSIMVWLSSIGAFETVAHKKNIEKRSM